MLSTEQQMDMTRQFLAHISENRAGKERAFAMFITTELVSWMLENGYDINYTNTNPSDGGSPSTTDGLA